LKLNAILEEQDSYIVLNKKLIN